jgi:hypothetical protein
VKLSGSTIRECSAAEGGGVAALDYAHLRLSNTLVTGCSAASTGGGATSESYAIVTMDDAVVSNCTAGVYGGGVSVLGSAVLGMVGSSVTGCRAPPDAKAAGYASSRGGGAYCAGLGLYVGLGSKISGNHAYAGGGVSVAAGLFVVNGAEIASNTATTGGGFELHGAGKASVMNAKILKNRSSKHGGAARFAAPYHAKAVTTPPIVFAIETLANVKGHTLGFSATVSGSACDMVNVTVAGNVAAHGGGGVFWNHATRGGFRVRCAGCTFGNNTASYGPDYATELVAWATRPVGEAPAALHSAKNRTALELAGNGGAVDAGRMQAALDAASTNFTVTPGGALPAFDVLIVDAEGQRVSMTATQFEVQFEAQGGSVLEGTLTKYHLNGSAIFDDVVVFANMETQVTVAATATYVTDTDADADTLTLTSRVYLDTQTCARGDYFDAGALKCVTCPAGSIAFTAGTTACVDCTGAGGITCLGGAAYQIDDGYWVAAGAAQCTTFACLAEAGLHKLTHSLIAPGCNP